MDRLSRETLRPFFLLLFMGFIASFVVAMLSACRPDTSVGDEKAATNQIVACGVSQVRFPTTREDFSHLYGNRDFLTDGIHLGRDIELPEGTSIHPIACGTVRFYGPASGYGTLAIAIEHCLKETVVVHNGRGESVTVTCFLSIYGHLRSTSLIDGGSKLDIRVGDTVGPEDVIGYVQNDAQNGDGAEHLHLGIRLQTKTEAAAVDRDWFRGYDGNPSQRGWYANPAEFLEVLMSHVLPVRWHPTGTSISRIKNPDDSWMIGPEGVIHTIDPKTAETDRLLARSIPVTDEELGCYVKGSPYVAQLASSRLLKFDDASTVYEYADAPTPVRYAFISYEAFLSWGWTDKDIMVHPANERVSFLANHEDRGFRRLRDGVLVKARGSSEVAVVSDGRRLPIFDWSTFLSLGYKSQTIVEIDPLTMDDVAYPRGPVITSDIIGTCSHPNVCLQGNCDGGMGGGTGEPLDASIAPPDMASAHMAEVCNGKDDDGNGLVDEIFLCPLGRHGPICVTSCGVAGYRVCEAPACDWSRTCYPFPETCDNTIDDDCDGKTDCADEDCRNDPACAPKPDMSVPPPDMKAPTDLVMPGPMDVANPNPMERRLWIEAGINLKASCQQGLVILIWDPQGKQVRSAPGTALDVPIGANWHGWIMTTTVCGNQYHGGWIPKGGSAHDAGFVSVRLDGKELVNKAQMVCADPYDGLFDLKIAIPLAGADEGSCP